MTKFAITADIRAANEKNSHIRKSKKVPGIVYGKTQDPISLSLDASEFLKLSRKAWESNIINLKVGKEDLEVLIHQTQKHPVTGDYTHVDFYAITRWEKLTTKIAIEFVGEAPAAKEWMIIQELVKELEVQCLPRDLVDHFEVDLWVLKAEWDMIRFEDMAIDTEKYDHHYEADLVIANATMPRAVVEETEESEETEEGGGDEEAAAEETKESE